MIDIRTFRAASMQEALAQVRRCLGPDAAVLHTREVRQGLWKWLGGGREIEVTASCEVDVPSRLPQPAGHAAAENAAAAIAPERHVERPSDPPPGEVRQQLDALRAMVEKLCERRGVGDDTHDLPDVLFQVYTDLIESDVSEELARELVDDLRAAARTETDPLRLKTQLAFRIEKELEPSGPLDVDGDQRRVVALVGPTGVGKTTTIAKLAANYHLRERRRVGLITVDTFRIAAVEQLRTYAEIIDLPMEVVSTPREMRSAVDRLAHLDLILVDTAGRSPRDEIRIRELKSLVHEAAADEVHLVLSAVASCSSMVRTAEKFNEVGTTALLLTKLDEADSLGHLLTLARACRLPISYVTHGQNVPDDIEAAEPTKLARQILGIDVPTTR